MMHPRNSYFFVKVPRPGDSEGTLNYLAQVHKRTCRPISTLSFQMLNVKQRSCEYQLLKYLKGLAR